MQQGHRSKSKIDRQHYYDPHKNRVVQKSMSNLIKRIMIRLERMMMDD